MKDTLVVWDLFSAHRDDRVLSFLRNSGINAIFVPGGCTGICQVMGIAINRPFKCRVRECHLSWCGQQVGKNEPWRAPSRTEVVVVVVVQPQGQTAQFGLVPAHAYTLLCGKARLVSPPMFQGPNL